MAGAFRSGRARCYSILKEALMLLLKHSEVPGLLTTDDVIEAVRAGFKEQSQGLVQVPPRTTIDSNAGHGWLRLMPAILNGSGVMGFKFMHSTPGVGVGYVVALYDQRTGALLAQIDADWITSQRTAASAAVAVDELANKNASTAGVIGSSEQARAMLGAVSRVRKFSSVKVYSPTPENRRKFAETMGAKLGITIEPVDRPELAVKGCDVVLSVFRAGSEPVIFGDWLERGTHLCSVSAVRPAAREIDDSVWKACTRVVADEKQHVFESGDGLSALASRSIDRDAVDELWQIVGGHKPGRAQPGDITLYKAVGYGLQDVIVAKALYEAAIKAGVGQEVGEFPRLRESK
jgi:alanine dehydrogenase